jgi:tRNA(His) guanylyltransferase
MISEDTPVSKDNTALGDRMKRYEAATRTILPRRTYTIIRADGRAFHSYLRGAARPFDDTFIADMDAVALALCEDISGTVFSYLQSDEISLLLTDFTAHSTEPWFAGGVQKMASIAAATATAHLNARRPGKLATFDARVFTIADPIEVGNYFLWRQRDAVRNSITMAAQAHFSHKQLHGVGTGQMQQMLWSEKQINWNDYPDGAKRGRVITRHSGEREVTFTHKRSGEQQTITAHRSWWAAGPAPHFTLTPDGFLAQTIPPMPSFDPAAQLPDHQP